MSISESREMKLAQIRHVPNVNNILKNFMPAIFGITQTRKPK